MNIHFKKIFTDSLQAWSFIFTLFFIMVTMVIVLFNYRNLPPVLPLYNKLAWGYDRFGTTWQVVIPFGLALFFCCVNFVFASNIQFKVPLLGRFLALTNIVIALFTCIFLVKIVFLVI